jgi:hypothetical protein
MPFNVEMPDGTIIEDIPEGTPKEQIYAKWKSQSGQQPNQPSFMEDAGSYLKNLGIGVGKQAVGLVPSIASGAAKSVGGVLQTGSQALEGLGIVPPGGTQAFTEAWQGQSQPLLPPDYQSPVGEFVGEVAPYAISAPETLLGKAALGAVAGGTRFGEQGTIDPQQRALEAGGGAALGVLGKPIIEAAIATGRIGAGAAKSLYRTALGRPEAREPLEKALSPITQRIIGVKPIVTPSTGKEISPVAKQIKSGSDWVNDADSIQRISGKRPEILLSQEFGSKRVASAEAAVLKSNQADNALNKLTEIQDEAVKGAQFIGEGLRKQPVSPKRAGAAIYTAQTKLESKLTNIVESEAAENFGKIRKQFGNFPMINFSSTRNTLLTEAEKQLAAGNSAAAKELTGMADRIGTDFKTIESVLSYRKARARNARGVGSISGLGREDTSEIAANIVKSVNDDILDAGARSGNPRMQAELEKADKSYRLGYDALRKARDSTLGRLVNIKSPSKSVESINKRARLTADPKVALEDIAEAVSSMKPSEFQKTMRELNAVDPTINKRVGRFLIDKSLKESEIGGARLETEATHNITAMYDSLKKSNAFATILNPVKRNEAETIMRWIARAADRTGGGAPADPLKGAIKGAMAGSTLSAPFVIQSIANIGMGPFMEKALFTEAGRKSMRIIMKYPNVPPAVYAKAQSFFISETQSQGEQ